MALGSYEVTPRAQTPAARPDGPLGPVEGDLDDRYRVLRPIDDCAAVRSRQAYVAQDLRCRNCGARHGERDMVCDTCGLSLDEEITLMCQVEPGAAGVARRLMEDLAHDWPDRLIRVRAVFEHEGVHFAVLADGMSQLDVWHWGESGDFYDEIAKVLGTMGTLGFHGYRIPILSQALGVSAQQLVLTPLAVARPAGDPDEISGLPSIEQTSIEFLERLEQLATQQEHPRLAETLQGVRRLMAAASANYLETGVRVLMEAADATRRVPALRLVSGRVSSEGVLRRGSANEDSAIMVEFSRVWVAEPHSFGFYGVADGMGGHDAGEVASRLALEALASWVLHRVAEPWLVNQGMPSEEIGRLFLEGVEQAHRRVRDGGEDASKDMGTTLTAAVVVDTQVFVVNVGDSRTYLWRAASHTLRQVSHDHSVVQELVDRGELAPEDVYTDPRRNVILASLGAPTEASGVDLFTDVLEPNDRLMLCSDGLWEMVFDPHLAAVLERNTDPQACAEELVNLACAHGGVDNVTAVVVQLQERPAL